MQESLMLGAEDAAATIRRKGPASD